MPTPSAPTTSTRNLRYRDHLSPNADVKRDVAWLLDRLAKQGARSTDN